LISHIDAPFKIALHFLLMSINAAIEPSSLVLLKGNY
jgi:hypothetical protein